MKSTLEGINRVDETKDQISDIEEQRTPNQISNKRKESKKNEDSLRSFWENVKSNNSRHHRGTRRRREQRVENRTLP